MQWLQKDHRKDILARKINVILTCSNLTLKALSIAMLFMGKIQMMKMKKMKMNMMKILMMMGKRIIMCNRIKIIPGQCIKWGRISRLISFQLFPLKQWHRPPHNKFTTLSNKMGNTSVWLNHNLNQMICLTTFLWIWILTKLYKTSMSGKSLVWILSMMKRIFIITIIF